VERNVFVYGTLTDQHAFTIVTGVMKPMEKAVLDNYVKVSSVKSFPYIQPLPGAHVEGFLVTGVDDAIFARLDQYENEGGLYLRRQVTVRTANGSREAFTYVAGPQLLATAPRDIEIGERITAFIRSRIERAIAAGVPARKGIYELKLRARGELLGAAINELVHDHFGREGNLEFLVRHHLADPKLPSMKWLDREPGAQKYARNYLRLLLKTIIFNQLEERVYREFREIARVADTYYDHAVSALAALQFVGDNLGPISEFLQSMGVAEYDASLEYEDYAVAAIFVADELYRHDRVAPYVERIRERLSGGSLPLGCELEFSQLGPDVIGSGPDDDPQFDGFYYFDDFDLGGRLWKLGGHVDNHRVLTPERGRVRGFLELALGRLKVLGDLSKPVTADPVILSDLANAAVAFVQIRPHSLHISLQLEKDRAPGKPPALDDLLCLLILGGDVNVADDGVLRERRVYRREIYNKYTGLDFSRYNKHRVYDDSSPAEVIEYQFPRLFYEHSYMDVIMALKGYQLAENPPPLDLSPDSPYLAYNRTLESGLLKWADEPDALALPAVNQFLGRVEKGLAYETAVLGGHNAAFCQRWLDSIERKLKSYNAYIAGKGREWLIKT
jgi:gamma-glutamylcyclotransferase (GGCT)/AIG2-like uncharacterized protein YtfP